MSTTKKPVLKSKVYDFAKHVALIYLPALGTLYFALAGILNLPAAEQVVGSVAAIDTFLGVVLGISSSNYQNSDASNDGSLVVDTSDPQTDKYSVVLSTPLDEVNHKKTITLKIDNKHPED